MARSGQDRAYALAAELGRRYVSDLGTRRARRRDRRRRASCRGDDSVRDGTAAGREPRDRDGAPRSHGEARPARCAVGRAAGAGWDGPGRSGVGRSARFAAASHATLRQTLRRNLHVRPGEVSLLTALFLIRSAQEPDAPDDDRGRRAAGSSDRRDRRACSDAILERLGDVVCGSACPVPGDQRDRLRGVTVTADGTPCPHGTRSWRCRHHAQPRSPSLRRCRPATPPPGPDASRGDLEGRRRLRHAVVARRRIQRPVARRRITASSLTLDACASKTPPGIVNLFSMGPAARRLTDLSAAERSRARASRRSCKRFGTKASRATAYIEQDWSAEPMDRRRMLSTVGPGRADDASAEPFARAASVAFIGPAPRPRRSRTAESTARSESGERAAAEVVTGEGGSWTASARMYRGQRKNLEPYCHRSHRRALYRLETADHSAAKSEPMQFKAKSARRLARKLALRYLMNTIIFSLFLLLYRRLGRPRERRGEGKGQVG